MPKKDVLTFDSKIRKRGGTYYGRIPPQVVNHLGLRNGHNAKIQVEQGKHGKYISLWIPALQEEEEK